MKIKKLISYKIISFCKKINLKLYNLIYDKFALLSYSQEGEDLILNRLFEFKNGSLGYYVDVGAHHPKRFSNTYFFYKKGWSGINIEANPLAKDKFDSLRVRDINLQAGVSDIRGVLKYYEFNDPALNTFDENIVLDRLQNSNYKIINTQDIDVMRLDDILSEYLPHASQHIDFLTIDVEGFDLNVLISNDWTKYRPTFVLVEILGLNFNEIIRSEIYLFMISKKYSLVSRAYNTIIFKMDL